MSAYGWVSNLLLFSTVFYAKPRDASSSIHFFFGEGDRDDWCQIRRRKKRKDLFQWRLSSSWVFMISLPRLLLLHTFFSSGGVKPECPDNIHSFPPPPPVSLKICTLANAVVFLDFVAFLTFCLTVHNGHYIWQLCLGLTQTLFAVTAPSAYKEASTVEKKRETRTQTLFIVVHCKILTQEEVVQLPTNNALLINFRLSSVAEILLIITD